MLIEAYLLLSLTLFFIWCLIFVFSSSTRKDQLTLSILGLILAPGIILLSLLKDFRPGYTITGATLGLEDLLFAFCLSGIAAVIYQIVLGRRMHPLPGAKIALHPKPTHWIWHITIILALWLTVSSFLMLLFPVTSVYPFITGGLLIGIYIIADRHDLLMDALFSGLFVGALVFTLEYLFFIRLFPEHVIGFWEWQNISGLRTAGIPIEELLWAVTVGFTIGPLYEYVRKYTLK